MGEIAEMMLDGTLCEGCGVYMEGEGQGFPRYCSRACEPAGYRTPSRKPNKGKRSTPCPGCGRTLAGVFALAQHRAAKGH